MKKKAQQCKNNGAQGTNILLDGRERENNESINVVITNMKPRNSMPQAIRERKK